MHGRGGNQPKYLVLKQEAPHPWLIGFLCFYTRKWSQNLGIDYPATQHLPQKNPNLSYMAANLKNLHSKTLMFQ
jgi:hypothetical protein